MDPIVLLAEPNEMLRKGLSCWLARNKRVRKIAEADNLRRALAVVDREKVDVAVVGMDLPDGSARELVEKLSQGDDTPRCILVVKQGRQTELSEALCSRAMGLIGESSSAEELQAAIDSVASGRRHVSRALERSLLASFRLSPRTSGDLCALLTARERTVLRMIGEGDSNRRIAERLGVSARTVDTHRLRLMRKLGIHKTAGLVRFAIREGLVTL